MRKTALLLTLSSLALLSCEGPTPVAAPPVADGGGKDAAQSIETTSQALETSLCGDTSGLQSGAIWPMFGGWVATGLAPVGTTIPVFGQLPPLALGALGVWNIKSAQTSWTRSLRLLDESLSEDVADASARNLLGVLPYGEHYDDPGEISPGDFWHNKVESWAEDPWEFIFEIGTLF